MEDLFFTILKIVLLLTSCFSVIFVLWLIREIWITGDTPLYNGYGWLATQYIFEDLKNKNKTVKIDIDELKKKRLQTPGAINIWTGKEETMENKEKSPLFEGATGDFPQAIPGYIQRMAEEKSELEIRVEKLTIFIRSEKNLKLSKEEYEDLLLQRSAMQEYLIVLKRRLQRAFKKEGIE